MFIYFGLGFTLSGWLLDLCLNIVSGCIRRTICSIRNWIRSVTCKPRTLSTVTIFLALFAYFVCVSVNIQIFKWVILSTFLLSSLSPYTWEGSLKIFGKDYVFGTVISLLGLRTSLEYFPQSFSIYPLLEDPSPIISFFQHLKA